MPLSPGDKLGPYEILGPLGAGGMGEVYRAREWYAITLLDRNGPGDAARARGLLSEALVTYESMEMSFHANRTSARLAGL
jgi:hypothetical protein